jgi:hypothetical protein
MAFQKPNALNCSIITIITHIIAIATLKFISAVGIFMTSSIWCPNIGNKNSKNTHIIFENSIKKKSNVIYIFIHLFSFNHRISSKNSNAFSKANSIIIIIQDFL